MRGMKRAMKHGAAGAVLFGCASAALAGTLGALEIYPSETAPVTALSDNVTYSTPAGNRTDAMQTFAGFVVGNPGGLLIKNVSGNTINKVTVVIKASVSDPLEKLTLREPEKYLPAQCTWEKDPVTGAPVPRNEVTITCNVGQLKSGASFDGFNVFYIAPEFSPGFGFDTLGSDKINFSTQMAYAEGGNGPDPVEQNSTVPPIPQPGLVTLGTLNPTNIKSGVPKGGAKLFSGDAGIPKNEAGKKFTEVLTVPDLNGTLPAPLPYTLSRIDVSSSTDLACVEAGRFVECPIYKSTIAQTIDPTTGDATSPETRFDPAFPVTFIYRVDASNLKVSPQRLLSTVKLLYSGPAYSYDPGTKVYTQLATPWTNAEVGLCPSATTPLTNGMPCLTGPGFCYKRNQTGGIADLEGDCEWKLLSTGNGFLRLQ